MSNYTKRWSMVVLIIKEDEGEFGKSPQLNAKGGSEGKGGLRG
jgi:hypothetical protein